MKQLHTDIVIIGGGLAGLYTALNINSDKHITIIVKEELEDTNSRLAQGGIAGELTITLAPSPFAVAPPNTLDQLFPASVDFHNPFPLIVP